ncbi:lactate 2-monooxygenase [Chryseolinea sp. T2]|uniref:lactate 2-monooxygenase n=1 Tax=Chryseolinea sp. T2 TaxID=3129255 RepID=UPI00307822BB
MEFSAQDLQRRIYLEGLAGRRPAIKADFASVEAAARTRMTPEALAYIAGGAGAELTMASNRAAFDRVQIVPRVLRDVSTRSLEISMFGGTYPTPLFLAPIGVLELVHPECDLAVARAAKALQVPMMFSNQASVPMEVCAREMGDAVRWFQLYWSKSRELVTSFVKRAEASGCSAIAVTLDTTLLGWRPRDINLGYLPFLEGKGIAQYTSDPTFIESLKDPETDIPESQNVNLASLQALISVVNHFPGSGFLSKLRSGLPLKAVRKFIATYSNPAINWDDLTYLRSITRLKILLKGVLHPDDARKAIDYGMDGIIVSNHGGRQVDGSIATLDALPPIAEAVNGRIPVLIDSGIRSGSDIFKALAAGAKAVCIGRPYVYGLAIGGQKGVEDVIRNLIAEFELTMALSGCKSIAEINRDMLAR